MAPTRPLSSVPPPPCSKCGSTRITVTGKSEAPAMTYVRCEACGYMTAVPTR
jgi:predicted RNA-binding Zn-ribbon protein involved in translation (DUF1610 family)